MALDDRLQLFQTLSDLPRQDFERLLFALKPPAGLVPGPEAPQMSRVKALLDWAEGSSGRGIDEVQDRLAQLLQGTMPSAFDFSGYLKFVCQDPRYQEVRGFYTETEVLISLEAETVEQQHPEQSQQRKKAESQKVERFPVLEGLREYALGEKRQHVLLAGRPGSGKSTTLKRLLLELADTALGQPGLIPVFVQLKSDRSIKESIIAEFRRAKVRVTPEQVDDWLLHDQLLLLLDGVNEIPSQNRQRQVQEFREDNPTTPMIFTTRDLAAGGDLGIQKRLEMRPLSEPQMREFVQKYLPKHADTLLRQLKDRLREIAETPLLLKMLCDVFDPTTGQIPQSKGELFRLFDQDYERKKKNIEAVPASENFWEFKSEVLQFLAFSMIQTDNLKSVEAWYTLPRSRAEREIEEWLKNRGVSDAPTKAKLWLKDLLRCHLLQDAREGGEIEFRHQLFQEYYAAKYLQELLTELSDEQLKHDYLNLLKWTEPIALMLALVDEEKQALRVVELAICVDWILGARLAGKVKSCVQKLTIELLINLKAPLSIKAELLGASQSKVATQNLIELLGNPNPTVRKRCAWSLGEIGSIDACNALSQAIEDSDPFVRNSIVFALYEIGIKSKFEAVIFGLMKAIGDEDRDIRQNVVDALVDIGGKEVFSSLIKALHDPSDEARTESIEALGRLQEKAAISSLLPLLRDENPAIRRKVADALGLIGDETIIGHLSKSLRDDDISVRIGAGLALRRINTRQAIDELNKAQEDYDAQVQWSARFVLGKEGQGDVISRLLEEPISDSRQQDEKQNTLLSGDTLDREDVSLLFASLHKEGDNGSRLEVVEKLGKLGQPKPLFFLRKIWIETEDWHYLSAILAIQNRCQFYNYEIFQGIIPQGEAISLYVSYAPADKALQTQLANHLTLLKRQGIITSWSSHQILPGSDRIQTIHQQLNTADIILLLISADSLADDTCYHLEIQHAMERHQSGEAHVILILLCPADWQGASFSHLLALPQNHQPVTTWPNQDEAFLEIAKGIRTVAMGVRKARGEE